MQFQGAVFDVPSNYDSTITDRWHDGKFDSLEVATQLPECEEEESGYGYGGGRGFGNSPGRFGRGGGRGNNRGFGDRRGGRRGGGGFQSWSRRK